jgi:hypothetical protein
MKKFTIMAHMGRWEKKDGKRVISGKVEKTFLVMEDDDQLKVWNEYIKFRTTYLPNGEWISYSFEPRKWAKKMLRG